MSNTELNYVVVPDDDEDFDPGYAPGNDDDNVDVEEHPEIPQDLSEFDR